MPSQVRVNIDLEVVKGQPEKVQKFLADKRNIVRLGDFITAVLLDDEDEVKAVKIGGHAHVCYAEDDAPCQECRGTSQHWPYGTSVRND